MPATPTAAGTRGASHSTHPQAQACPFLCCFGSLLPFSQVPSGHWSPTCHGPVVTSCRPHARHVGSPTPTISTANCHPRATCYMQPECLPVLFSSTSQFHVLSRSPGKFKNVPFGRCMITDISSSDSLFETGALLGEE